MPARLTVIGMCTWAVCTVRGKQRVDVGMVHAGPVDGDRHVHLGRLHGARQATSGRRL
jgi:hypothetical protein